MSEHNVDVIDVVSDVIDEHKSGALYGSFRVIRDALRNLSKRLDNTHYVIGVLEGKTSVEYTDKALVQKQLTELYGRVAKLEALAPQPTIRKGD